jgi:hypothetical protein
MQSDDGIRTGTRIVNPAAGTHAILVGVQHNERLTPSVIGFLDRRLRLKSDWFSIDEDGR